MSKTTNSFSFIDEHKLSRDEIREWLGSHGLPHNEVEGDILIDFIDGYANSLIKNFEKLMLEERKSWIQVFEQKMTNLGVKWGKVHKADCECGDTGCLKPLESMLSKSRSTE